MEGNLMAVARDSYDARKDPASLIDGKHVTCFEEPDIIYMKFGGTVTTEDALELLRRQVAMSQGKTILFFLIDAEDLDNIAPEGRRAVAETLKEIPLRGMAVVKAPLKAKVVTKLVITAINLFRRDSNLNPVSFFDTENEAQDWIANRRKMFA
jgi:SpoIIAA-like